MEIKDASNGCGRVFLGNISIHIWRFIMEIGSQDHGDQEVSQSVV
jgi:hypothetical protein